jgi:L-2,4-diaminobutyric acid acetyltransferase
MLLWLLRGTPLHFLETTVTPSNTASRALFTRLAQRLGVDLAVGPGFPAEVLGPGHEPEDRFRIGPIDERIP